MSDYTTRINDLYNLKLAKTQLEDQKSEMIKKLAEEADPRLQIRLQAVIGKIAMIGQDINAGVAKLYADPLTDPLLQIDEAHPLLLLPLRIETRFANSGMELWVRVYPDEIAVNAHETALTESEIKAGSWHWKYLWQNAVSPEYATLKKKTWSQIANQFGTNRTSWILLKTQPIKLKDTDDFSDIKNEADLDPGQVKTKDMAWSQAAEAEIMPDLLKLRLYVNDIFVFESVGNPILHPLPVTPDPAVANHPGGLDWKDTGLEWLENFDKALEIGMAFKIDLSAIASYQPATGFSRIAVMGIRTLYDNSPLVSPPNESGATALSALLESHRFTPRGLALVPQGIPTNNTEERGSGYGEQHAYSEKRYQQDQQPNLPPVSLDEMDDGGILALTLGIDPSVFQQVENKELTDHRESVLMNKALYSATLGFFLEQLLHPLFAPEDLNTIRTFFCSYVSGRGPVPVIRTGAQPYGILPTSNFKAFQWNASDKDYPLFQKLSRLLTSLDLAYETMTPGISKLGQLKDPHLLLDDILGLYPNSESFYQRVGYSENFIRNVLGQTPATVINPLLEQLMATFSTYTAPAPEGILQLKKIILETNATPLNRNKMADLSPVSETNPVVIPSNIPAAVRTGENYLQWLAHQYGQAPLEGIEQDYYNGTDPRLDPPVLYQLLKHGLQLQLSKCVFHWLSVEGYLDNNLSLLNTRTTGAGFIGGKEYLNMFSNREDITPMELLLVEAPNLPFLAPGENAAAYLLKNYTLIVSNMSRIFKRRMPPQIANDFRHLKEILTALDSLARLPSARLERVLIEHLDCLSYRADAWHTALFSKKLELNRNAGFTKGAVIGAYGWLENLKPAANVVEIKESDLPEELRPGTGKPIIKANAQGGYIHAPSLTQAKATALLRNAYLHYHNPADPEMMAVNLSAHRVKKALDLFDGIQKGHSAGELLGYKLERHLHDQPVPLDKYIRFIRAAFPSAGRALTNPGNDHEQPAASENKKPAKWINQMDGLAIVNKIKSGSVYPFGITDLPQAGAEANILQEGIADLVDTIDAMKDLMVAESIHQLVQGNTERAGALLKSVNELKPPARFESVRTPRTPAHILTHRAAITFTQADPKNPVNPWPSAQMSQRALVEPGLNQWLAEVIGSPENYQCRVTETESRTNAVITIADLGIQPIDLVYMAPAQADKEESEFSRRIAYYYRITQQLKEATAISVEYDKSEKNNLTIAELLPLLRLLKDIVTNSKALNAADFDLQQYQGKTNSKNLLVEKSGDVITDIGTLVRRKKTVTTALEALQKRLKQTADSNTGATCMEIRETLVRCCEFYLPDAFPVSSFGEDQELRDQLVIQSQAVIKQIEKMLRMLTISNTDNEENLVSSLVAAFGPAFKILPVFHFDQKEKDEVDRGIAVQDAYNAEKSIFSFIVNKTNISAEKHLQNWLNEVSCLRPNMASFEAVRMLHNAFREDQLPLRVLQLPYASGDNWLGLEFPEKMNADKGKLSLLLHHFPQQKQPDWGADFSGFLLDEWVEEIPGDEELTGISFQYNQPDSQPPQVLLMAVSPTEGSKWNWDGLSNILDDTLRRAKQRAVGTTEISKTDWVGLLPGIIAEFSETKANLSAFFRN